MSQFDSGVEFDNHQNPSCHIRGKVVCFEKPRQSVYVSICPLDLALIRAFLKYPFLT